MFRELLVSWAIFLGYYVAMVVVLVTLRRFVSVPGELFRKLFHISVAGSVFVLLHAFSTWYAAVGSALVLAALIYPLISWAARIPGVLAFLEERHPGEVRGSLLLTFFTLALLISLGWGWLGPHSKFLVAAAVMAWGFGDAAAALIGKRWGQRKLVLPGVDPAKTAEGALAMFAFAAAAVFVTLLGYTDWPWYVALLAAAVTAPVSMGAELLSHRGVDTLTVPLATFAWLALVAYLLGLAGLTA